MNIIGYHISDVLTNSRGEVCSEPPYLEWLLKQGKKGVIQIFYHMDYDVANLIKLLELSKEEGQKLLNDGSFRLQGASGAFYTLTYYPSKFFAIDKDFKGRHIFSMFSNMSQYEDESWVAVNPSLAVTQAGAERANIVGEQVYDALTSIGLSPNNLTSPISVFRKEVLDNKGHWFTNEEEEEWASDIPTEDDIPVEAGEIAYQCAKGAWLEAFSLGHWEEAYDYDQVSAYAFQLMRMPNLRLGYWSHSRTDNNLNAISFYKGRVTMWADFHPILYKKDKLMSYTPVGSWDTFLTGDEWAFIIKYNLGSFEMEEGHWWLPDPKLWEHATLDEQYPFWTLILDLYHHRDSKGGMKNSIVKRMLAGLYGLCLQVLQYEEGVGLGDYFNSVYGAYTETRTRLENARFCLANKIIPLHIAVDGILTDRKLVARSLDGGDIGNKMGDWKLTSKAPTLISSTGAVAIEGKLGTGEFALDYKSIMSYIAENPDSDRYAMNKLSPVTLKTACEGDFGSLGLLKEITRSVVFGDDVKRAYINEITTGSQLINSHFPSMPWDVSFVQ